MQELVLLMSQFSCVTAQITNNRSCLNFDKENSTGHTVSVEHTDMDNLAHQSYCMFDI